ncbi:alpha/beta fold hydrolase [Phenylobacterium sp. 20VBR1]|uniref:Alpha/beta fold hydrolase n=1 Tax=Phenylobacterium glaciei TaxID=2803784 RepID=A0A941CYR5_9CAUL|nr:alpha/beta hydrolase [Phenylobacterium glaciei]MBR7618344.1 alpha/beta fold hydrolase [Phenylobacterium glaciei]
MEYLVGAGLGLAVGVMATFVGFDRGRAFYPVVLIVVASYHDLFAVMGGSLPALGFETLGLAAFWGVAVLGFRTNLWWIVAALAAHGVLDLFHARLVDNPGVPSWWPAFCLTYDLTAAAWLARRLLRTRRVATPGHGVLAAALAAGALFGTAASAAPAAVEADGHAVAYQVQGQGRPVLVLISGLGDGMASFREVAPDLAAHATVILYDRAGYGGSGAPTGPRDAAAVDRELQALLAASGVAGPYVLAGHSIGGLYAEYIAAHHPDEVAGLILEESRPAGFTRRCQAAGLSMCVATPAMMTFAPKGAQAEVAALDASVAQVEALVPVVGKPVLVLSRAPGAKPFDRLWTQAQSDLAGRYRGAVHRTAPAGGHYVHRDQRAWFVAQVTGFLAAVP